jgi:hypothetical protein
MKKAVAILALTLLSGCSTFSDAMKLFPKPYDPVMGKMYIELKMEVNELSCKEQYHIIWDKVEYDANILAEYANFRNDPQAENIEAVGKNIKTALGKNQLICESFLKVAKTRLEIVNEAWSVR